MRMFAVALAFAMVGMSVAAQADTNAGPSTPQVPASPSTPTPPAAGANSENSGGTVPKSKAPANVTPTPQGAASGDSSGTTGISGPYNPTPPASNSGSAAQ
jgi:hypothetical protein